MAVSQAARNLGTVEANFMASRNDLTDAHVVASSLRAPRADRDPWALRPGILSPHLFALEYCFVTLESKLFSSALRRFSACVLAGGGLDASVVPLS